MMKRSLIFVAAALIATACGEKVVIGPTHIIDNLEGTRWHCLLNEEGNTTNTVIEFSDEDHYKKTVYFADGTKDIVEGLRTDKTPDLTFYRLILPSGIEIERTFWECDEVELHFYKDGMFAAKSALEGNRFMGTYTYDDPLVVIEAEDFDGNKMVCIGLVEDQEIVFRHDEEVQEFAKLPKQENPCEIGNTGMVLDNFDFAVYPLPTPLPKYEGGVYFNYCENCGALSNYQVIAIGHLPYFNTKTTYTYSQGEITSEDRLLYYNIDVDEDGKITALGFGRNRGNYFYYFDYDENDRLRSISVEGELEGKGSICGDIEYNWVEGNLESITKTYEGEGTVSDIVKFEYSNKKNTFCQSSLEIARTIDLLDVVDIMPLAFSGCFGKGGDNIVTKIVSEKLGTYNIVTEKNEYGLISFEKLYNHLGYCEEYSFYYY